MKIVYEEHFVKSLKNILSYIALDKKSAAKTFKSKLITHIGQIPNNPKMYKKSFYSNDETYRDMAFQGYTVTYKIEQTEIKILEIFKWQDK
ncbi:MAG: hypothetical protein A2329_08715 [Sulfurimonas sp. RIFOXYB2_FULL_37_5]|jgi:plasmid stabilization system protein ParE|uniref:type II toxin-antitoxin system RelE/ParE family toxin n=1 Tax=unclassified Sulfurimonas TaxID=2623549 RepID=UPI0008B2C737|nr:MULTISPECIES: type II toxin-antitoxin system RelE/ParE family toxin [unclassified Sulfurimonas]MBS4069366.1 type II toxin-antitoxin system RelE/ParE family toxin [Sulfurimonas sp.]MDD3855839.1 type II toxin-antitoxin system RelE/ParE family toxin [Sulfurimonas sp.]OHE05925.1 MAG: hypothetical protein A2345_01810 [Sulfurimonas sp. RIFOXYB12_FULL_35_9]OHE15397.1 MAG: hypothetical protein A2329_08715 [Sulfurimonas sp. RIFOXYB2_FULL_37_5]